jgi:hypothetical protein
MCAEDTRWGVSPRHASKMCAPSILSDCYKLWCCDEGVPVAAGLLRAAALQLPRLLPGCRPPAIHDSLSSRERLAAALMARMYAPRTPLFSSSAMPAMVVPAGEVTRSFKTPGCIISPSPEASNT